MSGMKARMVSVVMPVYNAGAYLAEAISSILGQTYPDFEFIIVDDGSTDESSEIIRSFARREARIHPLFAEHGGRGKAANQAIAAASGDLIARMDADDVASPERLAAQLLWMEQNHLDICGSYAMGTERGRKLWWFPTQPEAIRRELLFSCALLQPTVLMRAEIAKAHPYDEAAAFEDYELWTRLAPLYRIGNVPRILHRYRGHDRQSHRVESQTHLRDMLRYQRRYLPTLFPSATEADCQALAPLITGEAFPDLATLERAAQWLIRLSTGTDPVLSRKMARRWRAACRHSAPLGPDCARLYVKMRREFPNPLSDSVLALRGLCLLRVSPSLPLLRAVKRGGMLALDAVMGGRRRGGLS